MKTRNPRTRAADTIAAVAAMALACAAVPATGQVPVDDDGNVVGDYQNAAENAPASAPDSTPEYAVPLGDDGVPLRSAAELEKLVGPVALYPDDLLAVVLPASTYPLQVVEAARFLDDLETNPELEPEEDWDDSVVALVNYPEVVEMMNKDLDWTWQLGEAVVAQQSDVIAAIAAFRDQAYAAGNLKSDERQVVSRNDDEIIEIAPVSEEVIYVPYYEPERVVVYQPRPVYYYYPRAYPVYYYPYPSWYSYNWGYFWGVTTAFTIGWNSHCVNVYHPTFYGHPYYGYSYVNTWWYRRPSVVAYNNYYYDQRHAYNRYEQGDRWRPRGYTRLHYDDQRITRSRYYPNPATAASQAAQGRGVAASRQTTRVDTTRNNATRTPAAGLSGDRAQRSGLASNEDSRARIRQELEDQTRAAHNRANAGTGIRPPANNTVRRQTTETTGGAAARTATNPARQQRESGMTVGEIRGALAESRATRQPPAARNATTNRPAVPQPRPAAPQPRPAVPQSRPAVPQSRPAVPQPRPAIQTPRPATREAAPSRPSATTESASSRSSGQRSTARPR